MSDLDKIKEIEMEVMDYFAKICQENHLTYYLFWGTLLGAIRHKGFIPWDDDIDVIMMPDEYLKFLEIMEHEHSDKYYLQNMYNTKYCTYLSSKIRKYHTTMVEKDLNYLPFKKGINIDIFPLLKYPTGKWGQFLFMYRFRLVALLSNRDLKGPSIKQKLINGILHLIPRNLCNHIIKRKMEKLIKYDGPFSEYRIDQYYGFDKDWFGIKVVPFEDRKYIIPKEYDKVLTKLFGDYMTPPPESERVGHGNGNLIISFDKEYDEL